MIRVEVTEGFTLEKFKELKEIIRAGKDKEGELFPKDTFICSKEMAEYLAGNNRLNKSFIKIIEIIPEKEEKTITKKTTTKKKITK